MHVVSDLVTEPQPGNTYSFEQQLLQSFFLFRQTKSACNHLIQVGHKLLCEQSVIDVKITEWAYYCMWSPNSFDQVSTRTVTVQRKRNF